MKRYYRTLLFAVLASGIMFGAHVTFAQGDARQNALTLEQRGQNAEAEQAWQSIASSNPQSAEAYAHLGLDRKSVV